MVRDHEGIRWNPRLGGYEKPKCVFNLSKKYPIVEVMDQPNGRLLYAFVKGQRMEPETFKKWWSIQDLFSLKRMFTVRA
jgi:hypothetical protein